MRWTTLPIVAFDTETTGLQPFAGDRVIEFAAVVIRLDDDRRVASVEPHSWLVDPQIPIPKKVVEITGIEDSDVAGKPHFDAIAHEVHALLRQGIAVAHNFPFDMGFLTSEFERVGLSWPEPVAEVDTVDLSLIAFPGARSHRLGDVCKRLDVELVEAHRATNDAEACGRVFVELARQARVEDELQAMLDWARAVGHPPPGGPFDRDDLGRLVFVSGDLAGEPVREHPLELAWMAKALERHPNGWQPAHPESIRSWIARFLSVRGAGRHRPTPKTTRPDDWALDSCITEHSQESV